MNPQEYCQNKAAKSGSSFYYSFRFLPEKQRDAIIALYAFCREVDDIVDEIADHAIAQTKLNWWREEVQKIFHGTPSHPVAIALQEHIKHFNLAEEYFVEIIDGMAMDLEFDVYPTFKELQLYCYRVASVVGLLSVEIFGYKNRQTLKYAHELGMAFQLTNITRDVYEDVQRGRVYLPQDELARFNVTNDDLLAGKTTENVVNLLKFQVDRAQSHYQKAYELLPVEDRLSQRTGLIMAEIYQATLNEIERDGYRVLEHRVKLTPLRKLWLAWKTARREKRLAKTLQTQVNA
ncbi:MAG: presqualene diphosphate synthase HpnD [Gammaproteobacteria bacterium]|nr:presqualene diphosphate synthase HpnD [Gammaproteobacteria bacterium]